jgi:hypothetical protein
VGDERNLSLTGCGSARGLLCCEDALASAADGESDKGWALAAEWFREHSTGWGASGRLCGGGDAAGWGVVGAESGCGAAV